jgi:hypothetical protein
MVITANKNTQCSLSTMWITDSEEVEGGDQKRGRYQLSTRAKPRFSIIFRDKIGEEHEKNHVAIHFSVDFE